MKNASEQEKLKKNNFKENNLSSKHNFQKKQEGNRSTKHNFKRKQEKLKEKQEKLKEKRKKLKENNELQLARIKADQGSVNHSGQGNPSQTCTGTAKPKLPRFDEKHDDMDTFIERFERFAESQGWRSDEWAVFLSPLLTGKGLQVFSNMPSDEALQYDILKRALLKRYEMTEEGFRNKFRHTKPEQGETAHQFVARLQRYFNR